MSRKKEQLKRLRARDGYCMKHAGECQETSTNANYNRDHLLPQAFVDYTTPTVKKILRSSDTNMQIAHTTCNGGRHGQVWSTPQFHCDCHAILWRTQPHTNVGVMMLLSKEKPRGPEYAHCPDPWYGIPIVAAKLVGDMAESDITGSFLLYPVQKTKGEWTQVGVGNASQKQQETQEGRTRLVGGHIISIPLTHPQAESWNLHEVQRLGYGIDYWTPQTLLAEIANQYCQWEFMREKLKGVPRPMIHTSEIPIPIPITTSPEGTLTQKDYENVVSKYI